MNDYAPTVRRKRGKGPHGKRELNRIRDQKRTHAEQEAIAARRAARSRAVSTAANTRRTVVDVNADL